MEGVKHRTQISLDDWQYQLLLEVSRKTQKSLSSIIRELITERFASKNINISSDPILEIVGIGSSGHKKTARNHDDILYAKSR